MRLVDFPFPEQNSYTPGLSKTKKSLRRWYLVPRDQKNPHSKCRGISRNVCTRIAMLNSDCVLNYEAKSTNPRIIIYCCKIDLSITPSFMSLLSLNLPHTGKRHMPIGRYFMTMGARLPTPIRNCHYRVLLIIMIILCN